MYCNSVTFAKNATHCLPNNVTNSILKYYQTNDNDISIKKSVEANPYHIIFKSDGLINNQQASDHCNAIIFNGIEFQKSSNESLVYFTSILYHKLINSYLTYKPHRNRLFQLEVT